MAVNYSPTDPVAGASRAAAPTEVTRWVDYADTIGAVDTRLTTVENATSSTEEWLGVHEFNTFGGSASVGFASGGNVWALDAAATESIGSSVVLPSHWSTFDMDVWWTNGGAGSGNVVWQGSHSDKASGGSIFGITNLTSVTVAAPVSGPLSVTTLGSGIAVPAAGSRLTVKVSRLGTDAADTLANDAWLYGVALRRAS